MWGLIDPASLHKEDLSHIFLLQGMFTFHVIGIKTIEKKNVKKSVKNV